MKKLNKILLSLGLVVVTATSCDLDVELHDRLEDGDFPANDEEFQTIIGANYRSLILYYDREIYMPLNSSTDEWTAPTRSGGAWLDGGRWQYFANHTWTSTAADFNDAWNWMYSGIANINNTLRILDIDPEEVEGEDIARAELRGLRAYFYFLLCDNFGNVPIKLEDSPEGNIAQSSRKEVFEFIESELLETIPLLVPNEGTITYARFTKQSAQALLAKLYLNSKVYTGTERWSDVITQCDAIIASNAFSLLDDYFDGFAVNNNNNGSHKENIFVIPYDKTEFVVSAFDGMAPNLMTMHPGLKDKYGLSESPWNGFSAIAEFYNSFDDADVRKEGWIAGPQVDASGNPIMFNDAPLNINANWVSLDSAKDNDGARSNKFEMQSGNPFRLQDNDVPIFRFADVLLMKGEAHFRLGQISEAEAEFNKIRARAKLEPYNGNLTLDEMLAERGREFYFENWRRNDLVRFDKFGNGTWRFKTKKEPFRDLYPIPQAQLSQNPLLKPNPGY